MSTRTLADLTSDVRSLLQDPNLRSVSQSEVTRWLNDAQKNFSSRVYWYQRILASKGVINQQDYPISSDFLKAELVIWNEAYRVQVLDESEWMQIKYVRSNQIGAIPTYALFYPADKTLQLHPAPSATAASTTLSQNINATAETIPVASTTGFASSGRALIGTEQIRYFGVDSTNLLQCVRGDADTTPTNHSQGDVVDYGSIVLYTRALPPDLVNNGDLSKLPELWIEGLVYYAVGKAFLKKMTSEGMAVSQKYMAMYFKLREEAALEFEHLHRDGAGGIKDEDVGMGFYAYL